MEFDDKIQDYLDGMLDDDQASAFERELETNPELKTKFETYQIATDLSRGLLEIDMKSTLEGARKGDDLYVGNVVKIPQTPVKSFRTGYGLAATIALLLSITSYFIWEQNLESGRSNAVFAEVYKEPIWPVVRSETDSLSLIIASFLATKDFNTEVGRVSKISSLDTDLKNYWISEMFAMDEQWDSVTFYLPALPSDHIKYDRTVLMREWIAEYGK